MADVLTRQNQADIMVTGSKSSLEQFVGRIRKNEPGDNIVVEPALDIGLNLMRTERGAQFYQFGPNMLRNIFVSSSDIAVFFNENEINFFKNSNVWSIDGTFSVCPIPWKQLYTISVVMDHHIIPFVFALLKSKTSVIYKKLIRVITELIPGCNPVVIISDFEKSAIDVFSESFPRARLSCCLFHLAQNIQKKLIR